MASGEMPRTLEEALIRLGEWMYEMWKWGRRVRNDIVELERKLGQQHGDPGDPPDPPWGIG